MFQTFNLSESTEDGQSRSGVTSGALLPSRRGPCPGVVVTGSHHRWMEVGVSELHATVLQRPPVVAGHEVLGVQLQEVQVLSRLLLLRGRGESLELIDEDRLVGGVPRWGLLGRLGRLQFHRFGHR